MPKKEVTINRSKWCRGGKSASALRTESGQSCCLGFVARAYGLKTPVGSTVLSSLTDDQDISVLPEALRPTKSKSPFTSGVYHDTDLHDKLVDANDEVGVKPAEREKKIKDLLAEAGIRVKFVG